MTLMTLQMTLNLKSAGVIQTYVYSLLQWIRQSIPPKLFKGPFASLAGLLLYQLECLGALFSSLYYSLLALMISLKMSSPT